MTGRNLLPTSTDLKCIPIVKYLSTTQQTVISEEDVIGMFTAW